MPSAVVDLKTLLNYQSNSKSSKSLMNLIFMIRVSTFKDPVQGKEREGGGGLRIVK
jgi:hypothetical protein